MATEDFIIALFCEVDATVGTVPKHPQVRLWPSEVVTLGLLFALKGQGPRAFYRWVSNNWRVLFPRLPHRTRLFRRFKTHQRWTDRFLATPTLLGVVDTYGGELIHPYREGRSARQIGKKGLSNHRWIVGGKLCVLLNQWGLITRWACATANVHDTTFHPLVATVQDEMVVLADGAFHAAAGDPPNLKVCPRGAWNQRMLVETVLSMLTTVCHLTHGSHRVWAYFQVRLAFTMALFNVLVQWAGLKPGDDGIIRLSIAQFSL